VRGFLGILRFWAGAVAGLVIHSDSEIAAIYTLAPDYASTDWLRILDCYETLQRRKFSPVIELNRIIVLGEIDGPLTAAEQLKELQNNPELLKYNLFHITRAHYLKKLGQIADARESLEKAKLLSANKAVLRFVEKQLAELGS